MKNPPKALSFVDEFDFGDVNRTRHISYHFTAEEGRLVEEAYATGADKTLRSRNHPRFGGQTEPTGPLREKMVARLNELRPVAAQILGVG
jgi:hypothetical protein